MDFPIRSLLIRLGPLVQQPYNWAIQKSRLLSDGQTTKLRMHIYHFNDERGLCLYPGECKIYESSLQSMPHLTIYSIHKDHSQNAESSSLIVTLLFPSGVL